MKRLLILFLMTGLLLSALGWRGQKPDLWAMGKITKEFNPEQMRAKVLAEKLRISLALVLYLRQEKMGWGEIYRLITVAKKSRQMIETILQLRKNNTGWTEIARKYRVNLKPINQESRALERELERVGPQGKV